MKAKEKMNVVKSIFLPCIFCIILMPAILVSLKTIAQQVSPNDLAEAKRLWDLTYVIPPPEGVDVSKALKRAQEIYNEAAVKGNADAQFVVGYELSRSGYSKESLKWHLLAAEQGHPQAQYALFEIYMYGNGGVVINKTLAEEMCTKAAKQGLPKALLYSSKSFAKNNVEKVFYAQVATIHEMLFMEKHRPQLYESVMKSRGKEFFLRNRTIAQLYDENKRKFVADFQNSCNNDEIFGKYLPKSHFETHRDGASSHEGALDDYFLTPEERKEVIKRLMSWSPVTEWKPNIEKAEIDTTSTSKKFERWEFEGATSYQYSLGAASQIYEYEKGLLKDKNTIADIQKIYARVILKEVHPKPNSLYSHYRYMYINKNNEVVLSEYNELSEAQLGKSKKYILTSTHPPRFSFSDWNLNGKLFYPEDAPRYNKAYKNFDFEGRVNSGLLYMEGTGRFFDPSTGYLVSWGFDPGERQGASIGYVRYKNPNSTASHETEKTDYAVKAAASPKEVKPDGQSTVEITATLYSSASGDNQVTKPISGKTVSFSITENYGITPGSLSAKSAITDANGQAKVVYTAPTAESLRNSGHFINSTAVLVSCPELKKEDLAYIGFISERGKVEVEPSMGISSSKGIVPPDKRFPALITATLQDENLQPLKFSKTIFSITGANPLGMLRGPNGKIGKKIEVFTDQSGSVEVAYFYASDSPPSKPLTEIVEVIAENMVTPIKAEISIGLNIIFDLVENGYEGKGIINAGEEVPIRVKIKDAWNPELRLNEIINYWGLGGTSGDTPLAIRLEIKNLSSAPDYLLDYYKLEKYPEAPFAEIMQIRSFKDKGELNHLRMPEYALKDKGGYAKIRPMAPGNHYYEARVTLTDRLGKEVFASTHPARKAHFNIKNGLPADATQIYFLTNPLNTETRESKIFATALDLMGIGALLSVTDAMYKINSGDSEGLFAMLFSEIKGVIFDKIKSGSAYNELAIDLYTGMSLAEKVDFEIMKDKTGPIAGMEKAIFEKLYNTFNWESGQLVILRGDGNQKLFEDPNTSADEKKDMSIGKGNFKISISGLGKKATDAIDKIGQAKSSVNVEIPAKELSFMRDEKRKTTSLKKGNVSIFVIPRDMKVRYENASEIKIY